MKESLVEGDGGTARSVFYLKEIEGGGLKSPKDLSLLVPNLHIPRYGSSMTSTIYMRGLGSRMENPVMAMYVDDIPVLDKNNYDFLFSDIRSAEVLRGPQGMLFGRNSMMGVISLTTLSPEDFQGVRGEVQYGTANEVVLGASLYSGRHCVGVSFRHVDGYYPNSHTGLNCDPSDGGGLRWRFGKDLGGGWTLDNVMWGSFVSEGGYPYALISGGETLPVSYNDPSGYRRLSLTDGVKLSYGGSGRFTLRSVSAVSLLLDRMDMDQDFTPRSMFTLTQIQRQGTFSEELVISPRREGGHWKNRSGVAFFLKYNRMSAPVTFKEDGINTLILSNANAHIPEDLGKLRLDEDSFPIGSEFGILAANFALYHETAYRSGGWTFGAGLRLDYEADRMDYSSDALVHFRLVPTMPSSYPCGTSVEGTLRSSSFQLLPRLSVSRSFGGRTSRVKGLVTAHWGEGYRAGGFNTQIFSDILQNRMMGDMMGLMGVHLENEREVSPYGTVYKPEFSDNFEVGGQIRYGGTDFELLAGLNLFCLLVRDQQITVFPPGMTTGRMMKNVGRSRSIGAEASLSLGWRRFRADASYGYTHAVFTYYDDGNTDYGGNRIPYSPLSTLSLRCSVDLGKFTLRGDIKGLGDIYWNEDNTLREPFRLEVGGSLSYNFPRWEIYLRGENLTSRVHPVFYFKSIGNEFVQLSRPAALSIGARFSLPR